MRKMILTTLSALALSTGAASAADLSIPKKAPAVAAPYGISGCYFGIAMKGGVDQLSANGSALFAGSLVTGSLNAAGAGIGGDVGCMWGLGTANFAKWVALEGSVYYQNVTASAAASNGATSVQASYASRWSVDQTVKIGGLDLSWLPTFGITFPTITPPTIGGINLFQPGLMYVSFGVEEYGIDGQFFTAGGTTVGVAPLVGAGIINQITDSTGKLTGSVLDTGCDVVFADRGLQIGNAFSTNGGPVLGTLSTGRKYECTAKVQF